MYFQFSNQKRQREIHWRKFPYEKMLLLSNVNENYIKRQCDEIFDRQFFFIEPTWATNVLKYFTFWSGNLRIIRILNFNIFSIGQGSG